MGLKETLQRAASTGLKAVGNVRKTATIVTGGTRVFNATTGVYDVTGTTTTEVLGVLYSRTKKDQSTGIGTTQDRAGLVISEDVFAYSQLDYPTLTTKENDSISIDSVARVIAKIERDPADALVILALK